MAIEIPKKGHFPMSDLNLPRVNFHIKRLWDAIEDKSPVVFSENEKMALVEEIKAEARQMIAEAIEEMKVGNPQPGSSVPDADEEEGPGQQS